MLTIYEARQRQYIFDAIRGMDRSFLNIRVKGDHIEAQISGSEERGVICLSEKHDVVERKVAHL